MSNYAKIYWLTRLDNIEMLLIILLSISVVGIIFSYMLLIDYDEDNLVIRNRSKFIFSAIFSAIILTFLPNKKDMIMIYAGGKTMDYIQQDTSLNKIPYQTTKIISDYLDSAIKEVKK